MPMSKWWVCRHGQNCWRHPSPLTRGAQCRPSERSWSILCNSEFTPSSWPRVQLEPPLSSGVGFLSPQVKNFASTLHSL